MVLTNFKDLAFGGQAQPSQQTAKLPQLVTAQRSHRSSNVAGMTGEKRPDQVASGRRQLDMHGATI